MAFESESESERERERGRWLNQEQTRKKNVGVKRL
jgi:hypothetical protein